MDELDEGELFTVCLDDDGHPVLRTATDMTAGEVTAAIDHLTANQSDSRRVRAHGTGCWPPQRALPRTYHARRDHGWPAR